MAPRKGSRLLQFDDTSLSHERELSRQTPTPKPGSKFPNFDNTMRSPERHPPRNTQAPQGSKHGRTEDPKEASGALPQKRPKTTVDAQARTNTRITKSPSPPKPTRPATQLEPIAPQASPSRPSASQKPTTNSGPPPQRLDPRTMQPLAATDEFRLSAEEVKLVMSSRTPSKARKFHEIHDVQEFVAWINVRDGFRSETVRRWKGYCLLDYVERVVMDRGVEEVEDEEGGGDGGGSEWSGANEDWPIDERSEQASQNADRSGGGASGCHDSPPEEPRRDGNAARQDGNDLPPPYKNTKTTRARASQEPSPRRLRPRGTTPSYMPKYAQTSGRQPAFAAKARTPSATRNATRVRTPSAARSLTKASTPSATRNAAKARTPSATRNAAKARTPSVERGGGRKRSATPESAASSRGRRGGYKGKKTAPHAPEVIPEEDEEEDEEDDLVFSL